MEDASRSRVTITLGRGGQVVKRTGLVADDGSFSDSRPAVGSKRSVRDRLGGNVDPTSLFDSKRQRGDGSWMSTSASNYVDDMSLGKDDLRYKIMLKRSQSSNHRSDLDLRDLLSRPAQSSTTSSGTQRRTAQPEDVRKHYLEPRDSRQPMKDSRNSGQLVSESKNVRQQLFEPRGYRERLPDPRDSRHVMPDLKDARNYRSGVISVSMPGQTLSSRSSGSLPQMESLRSSHTPWTLENLRQRPVDRVVGSSRGVSPPRRKEEKELRPLVRAYDESREASYASRGAFEQSRHVGSSSHLVKSAPTAGPAKTMALPHPPHPPVSLVQKNSYRTEDPLTVDSFLQSLGLDKYSILFKAEEVDMHALKQMGDADLKELGVPMGPRKKILLTLLARSKRQI
ncbi:OLC1v1028165C6 [Oldenlandia corymbosa var. corymbosa]|uniref:OLC1v1028165C6 n=1 Tax=Oldenlandia corymbosa var. corymbosa TaxID=529605 RepID=A0AAV1CE56_OLDCO|nr:OLC1v1028165C6 [Oldenlandia corymbosa var. corymbosa]